MANAVVLINVFKPLEEILISDDESSISKFGKSSLGSVVKLYLPDPDSILRSVPSRKKCISAESCNSRHRSLNFLAGAVVFPPLLKFDIIAVVETSDSRSVAVSFKEDSSTSSKTLDSIGRVCLFSTTPSVKFSALTTSSFLIEKSIS